MDDLLSYEVIIVITPNDLRRVMSNLNRIVALIDAEKYTFVGNEEVGLLVEKMNFDKPISFLNENEVLAFDSVSDTMKEILNVDTIPRGIVGWYYQQFLKMAYCKFSEHKYYMTWDGDTVPTKKVEMFNRELGLPFFDMKYEYHEEYFETLKNLLGIGKIIRKSFISEHMLFNVEYMNELINTIESKKDIQGNKFYEKILHCVREGKLQSNSFSEFETYGSFIAITHPEAYRLKDWHSIRYGAIYFKPEEISEEDYEWISKDFDAVSFEKNEKYRPEYAALFSNPEYRAKLSARQIVEAIQDYALEGLKEVWED